MIRKFIKPIYSKFPDSVKIYLKQNQYKYGINNYPYRSYTHKHKAIFIHIPKNAGTSVLKLLMGESINRDHLTFREFEQSNSYLFDKYYKFCFSRNPYDRAVSTYEYLRRGGNKVSDLFYQKLFEDKYSTFEEYVLNYLDEFKLHEHVLFKPQYSFVYDDRLNCKVDFCGKFENLNHDMGFVLYKIGISGELNKTNTTPKTKDYRKYYENDGVRKKIYNLYKKDFLLFGYNNELI